MVKKHTGILSVLLVLITVFTCFTAMPITAQAKSGTATTKAIHLKDKKTYKKYDVNGDGKADRLKLRYVAYSNPKNTRGNSYVDVYINGKKKQVIEGARGIDVYLIAPTKKKVFLIVKEGYFGGWRSYAYSYRKGKFRLARKQCIGEEIFDDVNVKTVNKSGFTAKITSGKHAWSLTAGEDGEHYSAASLSFALEYKFSGKKVKLASRYGTAKNNKVWANKSFSTHSSPTEMDYSGAYITSGDELNVSKIYIAKNRTISLCVETPDGQFLGWVIDDQNFCDPGGTPYFYLPSNY